ncbi:fasciclin domain-containing protein [Stenotrophomonas sp. CFBP8980]|uniref:fasciclin domain-containing protein n=1 Tax=Stenotrophomonas sp. CFBP8980 TaxID=3096523 RepID=UPI002A6A382C|nr:fasciclin domain-containing protein [Stenotrophomonas sp. CFBP8980]MDY1034063.1 fasciclin domain-containing protein [Stenotrophomonas sp. CFBP8980]
MQATIRKLALATGLVVLGSIAAPAFAADPPMVGGAPMEPTRTSVENASASKDHTTLVAAVKAAGLVETLSGPGPFTVFAPTNAAFNKLPAGTVDTLVKPENKAALSKILTYHVVPGKHTAAELTAAATRQGGAATLATVQGEPLTFKLHQGKLWIVDSKGGKASVSTADVMQSNGVVHVVDTVLMPK